MQGSIWKFIELITVIKGHSFDYMRLYSLYLTKLIVITQ